MASTQTFSEGNSTTAATETASRGEMNWKNIDDSTTAYSSSVITAGNNSFSKYQAIVFAGTYNSLSALTVGVDNATPATGITITGVIRSTGATPTSSSTGDSTMALVGSPLSVNFTGTSWATAFAAGTSTAPTPNATCYTQPLRTQLATLSTAAPGDIASRTFTWAWTES